MTWDITTPLGSDALSLGDDKIRELKTDIQTALRGAASDGTEAKFPGADTANPTYRYRGLKGTTAARPTFGEYGLYANTTKNTLQRDSGTAWEDIATLIPTGTVMVFYQTAVPTGWTQVVTQNDKALRVVSGSGGVAGGTYALSTGLTHHHTTQDHTLTISEMPSHEHSNGTFNALVRAHQTGVADTVTALDSNDNGGIEPDIEHYGVMSNTGGGNGHNHGDTLDSSPVIAYIDVVLGSKD